VTLTTIIVIAIIKDNLSLPDDLSLDGENMVVRGSVVILCLISMMSMIVFDACFLDKNVEQSC
jgi:hypothetical protein